MNPEISQKINELKNDRIHGANWLSLQALNILSLIIETSQTDTTADFLNELKMMAAAIIEARPNMISISNYTSQLLNQLMSIDQNQKQLGYVKNIARARVNEIIKLVGHHLSDYQTFASIKEYKIYSNVIDEYFSNVKLKFEQHYIKPFKKIKLDSLDKKILYILSENARIPFYIIAKKTKRTDKFEEILERETDKRNVESSYEEI